MSLGRVYSLRKVSDYTILVMMFGVLSFSLGFLFKKIKYSGGVANTVSYQINKVIKSPIFISIICMLSIYVYVLLIVFFKQLFFYQSLSDVRTDYYAHEMYGPQFAQLNTFLLQPFSIICLPVFAYLLFFKRNWKCLLIGFFLFGYYSLGGGRIDYMRILLALLFLMLIISEKISIKTKRAMLFIIGGIAVGFIIVSSAGRSEAIGVNREALEIGTETAKEHAITYSAGPIAAFDVAMEQDYVHRLGGYQHGGLTGSSLIQMSNLFFSRLGFRIPQPLDKFVLIKQGDFIEIGDDYRSWNALYTANVFFYLDFGIVGVIVLPFFFGVLFRTLIGRLYKYRNLQFVIIVNYLFFVVVCSVMDFGFTSGYVLLLFIILYIWGRKTPVLTQ